jgi:hypothetical protein
MMIAILLVNRIFSRGDETIVLASQNPDQTRPVWRRRRQIPVSAIVGWSLAAVGLGWLLVSAVIGLSSAV